MSIDASRHCPCFVKDSGFLHVSFHPGVREFIRSDIPAVPLVSGGKDRKPLCWLLLIGVSLTQGPAPLSRDRSPVNCPPCPWSLHTPLTPGFIRAALSINVIEWKCYRLHTINLIRARGSPCRSAISGSPYKCHLTSISAHGLGFILGLAGSQ